MELIARKIDLMTPRFTQREVLERTGISDHVVQNLIKRKLVPVEGEAPGRGRARLHSFANLLRFEIIGTLNKSGIPVSFSLKFAEAMVQLLKERQANGYLFDWNERYVLRLQSMEEPLDTEAPLYFEKWGTLTSQISIIDELDRDGEITVGRGRFSHNENDEITIDTTNVDWEKPLTHKEWCAIARSGIAERSSYLVVPIGYVVNALVFGFESEAD
ncbi:MULTISPECIES: hypothetical protein [Salipiger]|uniref:hypothetical protein n=1 Tax=Salipiger TaxID=263377 RepID=UPI0035159B71